MTMWSMIAKKNIKNSEFNKFAEVAVQSKTFNDFLGNLYHADISIAEIECFLQKNDFKDLEEFYQLLTGGR